MSVRQYVNIRSTKGFLAAGHNSPGSPHTHDMTFDAVGLNHKVYSQGNRGYRHLTNASGQVGGSFLVVKREIVHENSMPDQSYINGIGIPAAWETYTGPFYAKGNVSIDDYPDPIIPSPSEMNVLGTGLIARCLPTNPNAEMAVGLAEFYRERIPSTPVIHSWKDRTSIAKQAGEDYLSFQFGWRPLVNDIKNFHQSVTESERLIKQFDANSGRRLKRSIRLPIETEVIDVNEHVGGGFDHVLPDPSLDVYFFSGTNGDSKRTITTSVTREKWFVGSFEYYIPPFDPHGNNFERNRQLGRYLYGAELTPEVLWNLTPWSWAADWVGSVGDVLHNYSAFQQDGLVMHYGYVMQKIVHEVKIELSGLKVVEPSQPGEHYLSTTLRTTTKMREGATPYGFGLTGEDLSLKQIAILAALGITFL